MKKLLFVTVAVLTIFAIVGCDTGITWGTSRVKPQGPDAPAFTGTITFDHLNLGSAGDLSNLGIVPAGDPDLDIIANSPKALRITTKAAWGEGIDLLDSFFGFKAGEKITVSGTKNGSAQVRIQTNTNGDPVATTSGAAGAYTLTYTLTAADITAINANNPKALRIGATGTGSVFTVREIKFEEGSGTDPGTGGGSEFVSKGTAPIGGGGTSGFHIGGAALATLQGLAAGSYIEFTIEIPAASLTGAGWGVLSVGDWNDTNNGGNGYPISTPNPAPGKPYEFTYKLFVSSIQTFVTSPPDANGIPVNPSNDAIVKKIEFFESTGAPAAAAGLL
jgi:hypothetical protein